jgi:hypothetical protein
LNVTRIPPPVLRAPAGIVVVPRMFSLVSALPDTEVNDCPTTYGTPETPVIDPPVMA